MADDRRRQEPCRPDYSVQEEDADTRARHGRMNWEKARMDSLTTGKLQGPPSTSAGAICQQGAGVDTLSTPLVP